MKFLFTGPERKVDEGLNWKQKEVNWYIPYLVSGGGNASSCGGPFGMLDWS